ncbi:hypothetical protein MKP05_03930 [Halomonas sp. EGI 63088]|uniref:Uncharacterized protein n=1 Tax=Halomonas flagellata TaxID=2920385 RepID=A0ABS9RR17_9GAMM|nr:hypothetical protein [Halomonas flagellata]MCH4562280.1 hypothetical protein [Halomonas flagellata]
MCQALAAVGEKRKLLARKVAAEPWQDDTHAAYRQARLVVFDDTMNGMIVEDVIFKLTLGIRGGLVVQLRAVDIMAQVEGTALFLFVTR